MEPVPVDQGEEEDPGLAGIGDGPPLAYTTEDADYRVLECGTALVGDFGAWFGQTASRTLHLDSPRSAISHVELCRPLQRTAAATSCPTGMLITALRSNLKNALLPIALSSINTVADLPPALRPIR